MSDIREKLAAEFYTKLLLSSGPNSNFALSARKAVDAANVLVTELSHNPVGGDDPIPTPEEASDQAWQLHENFKTDDKEFVRQYMFICTKILREYGYEEFAYVYETQFHYYD